MDRQKEIAIRQLVRTNFRSFAEWLRTRHVSEVDNPDGVINSKRKNVFIAELWAEFMMYSALVRSFDSSLWNILEDLWNAVWRLSYQTFEDGISSYLYPWQSNKIEELINVYSTDSDNRVAPSVSDYETYTCIVPRNRDSFARFHETDNYFYDTENRIHYLIELKAGWNVDVKKAPWEKRELLIEYFMLKNKLELENRGEETIKIKFATAYNKDWEWNFRNQSSVRNCFADEELLIGRDYWNFICNDPDWFDVIISEYRNSAQNIRDALQEIVDAYTH